MRDIKNIVVHCTATQPTATVEEIKKYWKEELGWNRPGYHIIIKRDGEAVRLLHDCHIANGVKNFNKESIHIAYIGGVDKENKPLDNRTPAQTDTLFDKLVELTEKFPGAEIKGHRDFPFVNKACPSFDVKQWLQSYEPDLERLAA